MHNHNFFESDKSNMFKKIKSFYNFGELVSNCTLNDVEFRKLLKSDEKFDVIIVEIGATDALLGLGYYFNAPIIGISPFGASKASSDLVGTPEISSYIPNIYSGYTHKMTFTQRISNLIWNTVEDIMNTFVNHQKQQNLLQYYPIKNMPTIAELKRNVSLVFLNTHVIFGFPRPYSPNMIEIGGLHINKSAQSLPYDLQQFLDEAHNGTIYFSLGTHITFSHIPEDKRNEILNQFTYHYPHMRLLIKSDVNFTVTSDHLNNVRIRNWFPQQAILAHPNVKLFITHGGLLSTMETIYFGKPIIAISVAFDQHLNGKLASDKGYGVNIPYQELNGENFRNALRITLNNPR